jgi:hypothetical protein
MQKKGGVGKSLVSSIFMQYLVNKDYFVKGFDTDPTNSSFYEFKDLDIDKINILDFNNDINSRFFDILIDQISAINDIDEIGHAIIDTGASCFVSLLSYIKQNDAFNLLISNNNTIILHIPITGGSDISHTIECFVDLAKTFPGIPINLWLNSYHGELAFEGIPYDQFKNYMEHKKSVTGIVNIPNKQQATFGKDIEYLMAKKMTFSKSFTSNLSLMVRQRLKTFWNEISREIDNIALYPSINPGNEQKNVVNESS